MIKIKLIEDICLPKYQTELSAGADVIAHTIKATFNGVKTKSDVDIEYINSSFQRNGFILMRPFERILFGTGIILEDMPKNIEIQVRTRSGLALKKGLIVANSPGTVDADYKSEIGVILYNTTQHLSRVDKNERIAQLVLNQILQTETFPIIQQERQGGFGSTN
jgi:dUTP pyrophosphatase